MTTMRNDAGVMVGFCQIAMIRMMMMLMMVMGMTMMMEGAIGIKMTIRQEAGTLNWSCVGGRDVALLTTGCGNKEIVAQILRGDENKDDDKD